MAEKDPLDEESASDIFLPSPGADQADETVRQCHVLVIVNAPADFEAIVRHLKTTNGVEFRPTHAVRLADGLEHLAKGGVQVVLLDLNLPDSQGLVTLQKLRFHVPQVPVVVLANADDESLATEAASEGAQDYLVKGELHSGLLIRSIRYSVSRNRNREKLVRTVQELRESERRFKVMFENAIDGILLVDAETRQFQTGNQKICQMLACSLDELKTLGVSDVHPKEDLPYVMEQFEKQRRKETTLAKDIPMRRRDGTVFYADINAAPVLLGGKTYLMGVVRDITERRRAEEELRKHRERLKELVTERTAQLTKANEELRREITKRKEADEALRRSEARLQSLIRNVRTAVVVHRFDTSIVMANATASKLLGLTEKQLLGKTAMDPAWRFLRENGSDMPVDEYPVNQVLATRQPVQDYVVGVRRSDTGGTLWVLVNAVPEFTADGDLTHVIVSFMDITDRKHAQQQAQASLREKEVLLKEIHHRVKNNMQVISSLLNLQSHQVEDENARETLQDMRSRVASMAMVHEQLYRSADLARVDFAAHVRSLTSYLFRSYGDTSGAVEFQEDIKDVDLTLDTAIPCGLIINELVSNALKYAFPDGGKGEIRVGLHLADDRFALTVADNGVGLPADLDFRATDTMGLQVVTTLVKQLDGNIELDRHVGAAFEITFPKPV